MWLAILPTYGLNRCVYTSTRSRIWIRIWITIHMGGGGLSLDFNPVCLHVNATNLDQDLDQNPHVNGAYHNLAGG